MKKLTIKTKLAMWYAITMVAILCLFFTIAIATLSPALLFSSRQMVERASADIAEDIEMDDGRLELDDDAHVRSDTYYSVYDLNGVLVMHNHELAWLDAMGLEAGTVQQVTEGDEQWMVYDRLVYDDGQEIARLRIAMPVTVAGKATRQLMLIFLLILPIGVALAVFVGYFIAKKALKPVDEITQTAAEISRGDLSKRLVFPKAEDEVGRLAATFDDMLASLQAAFEREKQFTSDASHELRTPLATIIATAEEVLSDQNASNEQLRASTDVIYRKGRDMQAMLAQMLQLARLFEGTQTLELSNVDLGTMVCDIAEESRQAADARDITIATEIQDGVIVKGDLLLLTRVAMNLIDNSIRYGRQGGKLELRVFESKGTAVIQCSDDGIGIPPEDQTHIFERFSRSDTARSPGTGTGLGLALVEQIMKLHKGTVHVDSTPGKGSCFTVNIPAD